MREAVWGLAASCTTYVLGCVLWASLARRAWARWPAEIHPDLRPLREQAQSWTVRSLARMPSRRSLAWLAGATFVFLLLWIADFGLLFQVVYVAGLSAWWTADWVSARRAAGRARYERLGVEPPATTGRRRRLYAGGYYLFGFMISAGTLGSTAFLGAVIAEGVS